MPIPQAVWDVATNTAGEAEQRRERVALGAVCDRLGLIDDICSDAGTTFQPAERACNYR